MLSMSNIGDQVWFMTSRQTEPDLRGHIVSEGSGSAMVDGNAVW